MSLPAHATARIGACLSLIMLGVSCSDTTTPLDDHSSGNGGSTTSAGIGGAGGSGGAVGGNGGNGGSTPHVSLAGSPCPPRFVADIVACADDQLADPGSGFTFFVEAVVACADAEPLADVYDASCAEDLPTPVYCGADYSAVWNDLYERCSSDAITAFAERTCVFGANYRDALDSKRLLVLFTQVLDASSPLTNIEASQLVSAIEPSSYMATTPEEVFAAVDNGTVNRTELADRWNGRRYTVIEYGAGDNSYGRFFMKNTDTGIADIQDGSLYQCTADPGPGGESCDGYFVPANCTSPLVCAGPSAGNTGICSLITPVAKEGDFCTAPIDCSPDAYCSGFGSCISPWKTGVFRDVAYAPLVDGAALERTITVKGLATVPIDGTMDLVIRHPDTSELTITIINPGGTELPIFSGNPAGQDLVLNAVAFPLLGDESGNGDWTLRIQDANGGGTGWLSHWRISLASRWD